VDPSGSGALSDSVDLPPGSEITYTVSTSVPTGFSGSLTDTATATPPTGQGNPASATDVVSATDPQTIYNPEQN
jgi:trimeric autotransporter adhesin